MIDAFDRVFFFDSESKKKTQLFDLPACAESNISNATSYNNRSMQKILFFPTQICLLKFFAIVIYIELSTIHQPDHQSLEEEEQKKNIFFW